jgi:ubiquinone/menaquinone biosynthesis C-methylase UbiE
MDPGTQGRYIPALAFHRLTPLYDPVLKWGMRERTLKTALIRHARIERGMRVLDLGCGTGTLTIMAQQAHPDAAFTGLDGDAHVLSAAANKAPGLGIHWQLGLASNLPFPDSHFDRVLTSLVIHHLDRSGKQHAFREARRVLTGNGHLVVLDFTAPWSRVTGLQAAVMRHVERAEDNFAGRLPGFMTRAGFDPVDEVERYSTMFGPMAIWRAQPGG